MEELRPHKDNPEASKLAFRVLKELSTLKYSYDSVVRGAVEHEARRLCILDEGIKNEAFLKVVEALLV